MYILETEKNLFILSIIKQKLLTFQDYAYLRVRTIIIIKKLNVALITNIEIAFA